MRMNRKIAVYVNKEGETAAMHEAGMVKIYSKKKQLWYLIQEYSLCIHELVGMRPIREALLELAEKMEDCKIFVAKDLTGITYGIFDSLGFHLWEIEGRPEELLEQVFQEEEDEEAKRLLIDRKDDDPVFEHGFKEIEEGRYQLSLKAIQESEGGLTSKQVLKPFLQKGNFLEIEVLCSHVPGWLEEEIILLQLELAVEKSKEGDCCLRIRKSKSSSHRE